MNEGDSVRVLKSRDTPAVLGDKIVKIVKIDAISIWVEKNGKTYVLDRSQVKKV